MQIPVSAIAAGFVAILVGYASSAAIIFQAAVASGASPEQIASWIGVLGLGMGATCIVLSLKYRAPVITAWSTPGAALLVTALPGVALSDAIGAFLFCGLLITLSGLTKWFEKWLDHIPLPIASAMLAGVLARFGINVFVAMEEQIFLVGLMFLAYLVSKRLTPRYVVILVFIFGIGVSAALGLFEFEQLTLAVSTPQFVMPTFNIQVLLSVGVPLFLVTMASQNLPGVAVLRTYGYHQVSVSNAMNVTGITTMLIAPFGGFAINLAAITAAICAGPEAHPDPDKRYLAGVSAGVFYLIAGIFGATITALFVAFPSALIFAIAGIALFGTIATSLEKAVSDTAWREPAAITFLVTLSGMSLFGIGSAFWGLVAGGVSMLLLGRNKS